MVSEWTAGVGGASVRSLAGSEDGASSVASSSHPLAFPPGPEDALARPEGVPSLDVESAKAMAEQDMLAREAAELMASRLVTAEQQEEEKQQQEATTTGAFPDNR